MTNLTPELNLVTAEDDDDIADYNVVSLADSLTIVDGLFNSTTGHSHNGAHQGAILGPNAFADNTIPGAKLVDESVYGVKLADGTITADKLSPGALLPEALFANTRHTTGADYTVADTIMFVFCTAAVTITLPAAATTNRPITVTAVTGNSTVAATSGGVYGGSANQTTGAITNGSCVQGDSFTYKSDGTDWRVI